MQVFLNYLLQLSGAVGAITVIVTFINKTVVKPYQVRELKKYQELFMENYTPYREKWLSERGEMMKTVKTGLSDLSEDLRTLTSSIDELKQTISYISLKQEEQEDKLDDLEEKIQKHAERISKIEGRQ